MKTLLLICLLIAGSCCYAQTNLFVDSSRTSSGTGTSWATAYKTLNEALSAANGGSATAYTINVAKGTYFPNGLLTSAERDSTFIISRKGISLYGGFPSGGGTRNVSACPVILSGDMGNPGDPGDNSYHVMAIVIPASVMVDTTIIDGFTVTGGHADDLANGNFMIAGQSVARNRGGGITSFTSRGKVILNNCKFRNNRARVGCGVYSFSSMLIVSDCQFDENTTVLNAAITAGGGIAAQSGGMRITNSHFNNNVSGNGGAICYGGVSTNDTTANIITNCSFTGNMVINGTKGGAISIEQYNARLYLNNCNFLNNTAMLGGALNFNPGNNNQFNVSGCTFTGNQGSAAGGAIWGTSELILSNNNFTNNLAGNQGGGVYSTSVTMAGCNFTGDSAKYGGAAFVTTWSDVTGCNFLQNKAMSGGAFFCQAGGNFNKTSFRGNSAQTGGAVLNLG